MLFGHGAPKLLNYGTLSEAFPDPLGLGSPTSLVLATLAEAGCSVLLILGLGTRLAAIPLAITMSVAFFLVHAQDPWKIKELAFVYLTVYLSLIVAGGGCCSLDTLIGRKWKGGPEAGK
jgi:putative oxidoreductase